MYVECLSGSSPGRKGGDAAPCGTVESGRELSTAEGVTLHSKRDPFEGAPLPAVGHCLRCGASLMLVDDVQRARSLTFPQSERYEQTRQPKVQHLEEDLQQHQPQLLPQPQYQRPELEDAHQQQQHVGGGGRERVGQLLVQGVPGTRRPLQPSGQPPHELFCSDQPQQPGNEQSLSSGTTLMGVYAAVCAPTHGEVATAPSPGQHQRPVLSGVGRNSVHISKDLRETDDGTRQNSLVEDHLLCATCFQSTVNELQQQLQQERQLLHEYERALHTLRRQVGQGSSACDNDTFRRTDRQQLAAQQQPSRRMNFLCQLQQQQSHDNHLQYPERVHTQQYREEEAEAEGALLASRGELLLQELEALEYEREEATAREDDMLSEQLMLQQQKEELWILLAQQQQERLLDDDATAAVKRQLQHAQAHLQRLKHVNVINDAFFITVQDGFPSINSCRLGRVAAGDARSGSAPPSWEEINLGWGHMCFLLDVLFRKLYVHPRHYRLVPRGPSSCLIRKGDGVTLPLQGGGGETALGRLFFSSHRFDAATAAFVECVQEFFEALTHFARQPWPPYNTSTPYPLHPPELPFLIEGDRIGGLSIRMQCSPDEVWTKAIKYLLIDMKWLLAYTESATLDCNAFELSRACGVHTVYQEYAQRLLVQGLATEETSCRWSSRQQQLFEAACSCGLEWENLEGAKAHPNHAVADPARLCAVK